MSKKVADVLWEMLAKAGVKRCYGIVGDALNPIVDALRRNGAIEFVPVRHEEYGVFAAVAEAYFTGNPVVVCGTAKGASGVQGASFIALVATISVIPSIPVAGMALILGIDRFLSMFRALVNMIGNGVATLVLARWEGELDAKTLRQHLARPERLISTS